MIVTDLVKIKRSNKYEVYVDGELFAVLSAFGILDCRIKVGVELDETMLDRIEDAKKADAFETLLRMLAASGTTVMRAKRKLREKNIEEEYIEHAIEKAKEYGYLNDMEYAKSFVEHSRGKSAARLKFELSERGVSSSFISEALESFDEEEACLIAVKKEGKKKDEKELKKAFARLCNQGFPYDMVKRVYNDFLSSDS